MDVRNVRSAVFGERGETFGECRAEPPRADEKYPQVTATFPLTEPETWCMRWRDAELVDDEE